MSIKPNYTVGGSGGAMSPETIVTQLSSLTSPHKLPMSAIENGVLSVNGRTGAVAITAQEMSAQPLNANLSKIALAVLSPSTLMAMDSTGSATTLPYTTYGKELFNVSDQAGLRSKLGLSSAATMPVNVPEGLLQLDAQGKIPLSSINTMFSNVAVSGSYNDLTNRPTLFSGNYSDLNNKPSMFSGSYLDLVNKPTLSAVATSGSYNDLSEKPVIPVAQVNADWNSSLGLSAILNKPNIFSGAYADLTGKPTLFSGSYSDLVGRPTLSSVALSGSYLDLNNKPNLFSGSYNDLLEKPSLFSGNYLDLVNLPTIPAPQISSDWNSTSGVSQILNKPTIFDGNYNSLTNKPAIPTVNYPVTSVNTKIGAIVLTNVDVGAAPIVHKHAITDVTGLDTALNSKLGTSDTIPYSKLTGTPAIPSAQIQADWNQTTSSALDYIKNKPVIPVVNYPVTSVNSKTGAVTITNTDIGAASTVHTHTIDDVTGLQAALDTKITNGASLPYSSLTGKPTIPSNTSQITESGSLYYTDARVQSYLNLNNYRKVETLQGTTSATGIYQVAFVNSYTTPPHVNPFIINGTAAMVVTVSNITNTGCTVSVQQRNSVTLLGLEVLLAATVAVPSVGVGVLVVSKT